MVSKPQRIHLPEAIKKAKKSWNTIAGTLPGPLLHKEGWKIKDPEKLFVAMLLVLWRNKPLRESLGSPYKSGDSIQKHLIEWGFRGDLQRLWRAYLDVLTKDEISAWVRKLHAAINGPFKASQGCVSPPESRKHTFWFIDLSRILVRKARKIGLPKPDIRLPKKG